MKLCKMRHLYEKELKQCPKCKAIGKNKWYFKNKAKRTIIRKEKYSLNKQKEKAAVKKWQQANKGKRQAYCAKYEAAKANATPPWLTKEQLKEIEEFYILAQELAWLNQDGKPFHVDHIMPLQGKNSCGLHVPWNLQLLPAKDNLIKSNKT